MVVTSIANDRIAQGGGVEKRGRAKGCVNCRQACFIFIYGVCVCMCISVWLLVFLQHFRHFLCPPCECVCVCARFLYAGVYACGNQGTV